VLVYVDNQSHQIAEIKVFLNLKDGHSSSVGWNYYYIQLVSDCAVCTVQGVCFITVARHCTLSR